MDSPAKSFNPNKHLKEQFVSNLSGSSMLELFLLSLAFPLAVLLRRAIGLNFVSGSNPWNRSTKKTDGDDVSTNMVPYIGTIFVDFLFIVVPILLFETILADWIRLVAVSLALLVVLFIFIKRYGSPWNSVNLERNYSIRTSISSYRVVTMVITCMCILAVDFNVFPRRYAKTETYGTSLMDLGVGAFVLANALVSRQARNVSSSLKRWKAALQSTCPLILLGLGRLISTSGVDYQVHVGEYGVHWNFFFTLAAVSLLTSTINVHPRYSGILGFLILAGYQACLCKGLNVYLLSDERGNDIISQNKEGIFSIFGYWGMYLIGVHLGYILFFRTEQAAVIGGNRLNRWKVWILAVLCWLLTKVFEKYVEGVSRRTCNISYVALVFAANFQVLAVLMLSEHIPGSKFTLLEEAIDRNLLGIFLMANVLTGLVNLSVDTLFASTVRSMIILVVYAFTLCFLTSVAHFYGVRFKFWLCCKFVDVLGGPDELESIREFADCHMDACGHPLPVVWLVSGFSSFLCIFVLLIV